MTSAKRALVCLAPGFEEIEFTAPVDILRRGGVDVKIASILGQYFSSLVYFFYCILSLQFSLHSTSWL